MLTAAAAARAFDNEGRPGFGDIRRVCVMLPLGFAPRFKVIYAEYHAVPRRHRVFDYRAAAAISRADDIDARRDSGSASL